MTGVLAVGIVVLFLFLYFASYQTDTSSSDIYGATIKRKTWFQGTRANFTSYIFEHDTPTDGNIYISYKPQVGAASYYTSPYSVSDDKMVMNIATTSVTSSNEINKFPWILTYIDENTLKLHFSNDTFTMLNLGSPYSL